MFDDIISEILSSQFNIDERIRERERRLRATERRRNRQTKERSKWDQSRPERERNAARLLVRVHGVRSRGR